MSGQVLQVWMAMPMNRCICTAGMNIEISSKCTGTADVCLAIPVCRYCRCVYSNTRVQVAQMSVQQYSVCLQVLRCEYSYIRLQVLQVCVQQYPSAGSAGVYR